MLKLRSNASESIQLDHQKRPRRRLKTALAADAAAASLLFWYLKAVKASFLSPRHTTIGLLCLPTMTKNTKKVQN